MNWKPLAAAALSAAMVLGTVGTAFADGHGGHGPDFKDLGKASWAQGAITLLASQGLVNGISSTQFDPQGSLTLAQLAAILVRYQGNVTSGQTFTQQVNTAEHEGIFNGISGTTNLHSSATRAQAMAMILAALNLQQGGNFGQQMRVLAHFHDASKVPGWARKGLALAVELGILQGSAGDLMPQGDVTRAQLAVILQRIEALLGISLAVQGSTVQGTFVSTTTITTTTGSTTSAPTQDIVLDVPGTSSSGGSSSTVGGTVYGTVYGSVYGTQESFPVSPTADIYLGNKTSTLSAFKPGDAITLVLDTAGNAVVIEDTQGQQPQGTGVSGTATGTVTSISGSQITIGSSGERTDHEDGNLGAGTYTLESSASVVIAGASGTLSQVQAGDVVRLVVDQSGSVSTVIVLAQQQTLTGTLLFGQEDWMLVQTSAGPMRVLVNRQTQITLNGQQAKLSDIAAGDQITAVGMQGEGGLAATQVTATGNTAVSNGPGHGHGHD